jgi:hypothetical protein
MDRLELIKTLISAAGLIVGPVIGAVVAVTAIWVKEVLESQRNCQSWFEQTYITEGVDSLLAYLRLQDVQLTLLLSSRQTIELKDAGKFPNVENISSNVALNVFPVEALVRVETLLKTEDYTAVIATLPEFVRFYINIEPEKRSFAVMSEKLGLIREAYLSLKTIRQELLECKVKKKADVRGLDEKASIKDTLKKFAQEVQTWSERTPERNRLIDEGH